MRSSAPTIPSDTAGDSAPQEVKDLPDWAQKLVKDLLISVTDFFRDQDAFERKLLAIRKATQINRGKRTPGIDGVGLEEVEVAAVRLPRLGQLCELLRALGEVGWQLVAVLPISMSHIHQPESAGPSFQSPIHQPVSAGPFTASHHQPVLSGPSLLQPPTGSIRVKEPFP